MDPNPAHGGMTLSSEEPATLVVDLHGRWALGRGLPDPSALLERLERPPKPATMRVKAGRLTGWDSGLVIFLHALGDGCAAKSVAMVREGFPEGVERLLALAAAGGPGPSASQDAPFGPVGRIGLWAWSQIEGAKALGVLIGELVLTLAGTGRTRMRFRFDDWVRHLQDAGAGALPIVSLISILVGVIMAFVGAVQLRMFGAQIYVANLVGLAMAREMAPMMTAVIMAGRTGAAYAAQLGTMGVNEEIEALETVGVSPVAFLVLPRILALVLMMPLLCLYADLMGILGGMLVGTIHMDLSPALYLEQTRSALGPGDFAVGIVKSVVFAVVVAVSGCLRGLQAGKSASGVGEAATSAVVTSILTIIILDAVITVACDALGV